MICLINKLFRAKIHGKPFVHQHARFQIPWNVTLHDQCCIGDRTNIYSMGKIVIKERATVAQEAYICTGTHDFAHPNKPLITSPIEIAEECFIGARAFIMPGVTIGAGAIVGACSVVTKNVVSNTAVKGNPAK